MACSSGSRFDPPMPSDPFVREKFTRERTAARKSVPRNISSVFRKSVTTPRSRAGASLQSQNIEFTMRWSARTDREGDGRSLK